MGFIPKVGQYYYIRYRGKYGIFKKNPEESFGDEWVCDRYTKEDATKKVKELNNWK